MSNIKCDTKSRVSNAARSHQDADANIPVHPPFATNPSFICNPTFSATDPSLRICSPRRLASCRRTRLDEAVNMQGIEA